MANVTLSGTRAAATSAVISGNLSTLLGRVLIAWNDVPLEPNPTWTRMDDPVRYPNLIAGIDIHRGKQTERDRTDTGTATIYVNDTKGIFDYYNPDNAWTQNIDGKQVMLQAWNPYTELWVPQFRGFIDDYGYEINPALKPDGTPVVANVQIDCVDLFDYLGGYEVQPGVNGKTAPAGNEDTVHYYGTDVTDPQSVDDRIIEALTEAGIDSTMWVVFTGNVNLLHTRYDSGDAILNVLRDAADAEFPGIANIYIDKTGRFVFHGRYSRFDPDGVAADATPGSWDFTRWKAGDGPAIALDSDTAQVRVLAYSRARSEIINSAISYPRGIEAADVPGQVYEDAGSISNYGKHSWSATDLVINAGVTSGTYPPSAALSSANDQCLLFATFMVRNQKDPGNRIRTMTVKPVPPSDARAAATWGLLCNSDISDIINVAVGYPRIDSTYDSGIFYEDSYIEGVTMRIRPLTAIESGGYDNVEVDFDVSPAEWSMDTHGVFA